MPVRLTGAAQGVPMRVSLGMRLPRLRPAELARIWPGLAPLAVLDAPASLTVAAEFDAGFQPLGAEARLQADAGALDLGRGRRMAFAGLDAVVEGTARALHLREAQLRLPGAGADPGPVLSLEGQVLQRGNAWQAALEFRLDSLRAEALPRLWPADLVPETRAAALQAMPAGRLDDTRLRLRFQVPEALDGAVLEEARLALAAQQAVASVRGRPLVAALTPAQPVAAAYADSTANASRIRPLTRRTISTGTRESTAWPTVTARPDTSQRPATAPTATESGSA
jgi:hypothetical protein